MNTTNSFVFAHTELGIGDLGFCYTPSTKTFFGIDLSAIGRIDIHCPYNPETRLTMIEEEDWVRYNGKEYKVTMIHLNKERYTLNVSIMEFDDDAPLVISDPNKLNALILL